MDMGYTHSVLQECLGYLANQRMEAQGAKGDVKVYKWTTDWTANLEQGILIHSFIVIPECPPHTHPLLGQDLLNKPQATILSSGNSVRLPMKGPTKALTIIYSVSEEYLLFQNPAHFLKFSEP